MSKHHHAVRSDEDSRRPWPSSPKTPSGHVLIGELAEIDTQGLSHGRSKKILHAVTAPAGRGGTGLSAADRVRVLPANILTDAGTVTFTRRRDAAGY